MKKRLFIPTLLSAIAVAGVAVDAKAGPGPHLTYTPVTTLKQAEAIKPGASIAVVCGKCGGMTTMVADQDLSFLHTYTCSGCKAKYTVRRDPHGGEQAAYICEDDSGHRLSLYQAN